MRRAAKQQPFAFGRSLFSMAIYLSLAWWVLQRGNAVVQLNGVYHCDLATAKSLVTTSLSLGEDQAASEEAGGPFKHKSTTQLNHLS